MTTRTKWPWPLSLPSSPPTQTKVEVVKVKASIKRRAETSLDTPQQIMNGELEGILEDVAASLPLMNSRRRNIHQNVIETNCQILLIELRSPFYHKCISWRQQVASFSSMIVELETMEEYWYSRLTEAWSYYQIRSIGSAMVHLKYA